MALATMHDLMHAELTDLYSAETQRMAALPRLAQHAAAPAVRMACVEQLARTLEHLGRLDQIFSMLRVSAEGPACRQMQELLAPAVSATGPQGHGALRDAGILATAARARQFAIAAYGSTLSFATLLGHANVAGLLEQTLAQERAADACGRTNPVADVSVVRRRPVSAMWSAWNAGRRYGDSFVAYGRG